MDDGNIGDLNAPINYGQTISPTAGGQRRGILRNSQGGYILTQAVLLDIEPPTDACASFTEGTEVAYRNIGDPNVKVVVRQRGNCKYAVWSDGSEDMPYDWMPYVNTIGSFTKEAMRQCLKFNSEPCTGGTPNCNFALSPGPSDNNTNRSCSQGVTLNANCSGSDCGGVSYSWSGNGINGNGPSVNFTMPDSNGPYQYTVTATKAGCGNQTATVTLNVSGCGGGGSPCAAFTNGTDVAYRAIGDPNVKVRVVVRGACKYAVWSDGSEDMPRDWLPYITANPGFSINEISTCLKFNGESCGGRMAAEEPSVDAGLDLRVAPNPSNGRFTVRFRTQIGQVATLRLSDLNGRAVRSPQTIVGTGDTHDEAIVLPGSVHGVLLIDVVSGSQRASQKVVVD